MTLSCSREITGAFEEFSDQVDVIMENEASISNIDGDIAIELETEGNDVGKIYCTIAFFVFWISLNYAKRGLHES